MTEKMKTAAGVELSESEIKNAQKEGALDYIKEGSQNAMRSDTGTTSDYDKAVEQQAKQVPADLQSTFIAPFLELSKDELERRLKLKDATDRDKIAEDHARGLLALERSGKNRTGYVKMLMAIVGVKSPYEVTTAGPPYTNDETSVTEL